MIKNIEAYTIKTTEDCMSEQKGVVVFPVYKGEGVCKTVMSKLEYDFEEEINNDYQTISKVKTLGKIEADAVYVLSLGERDEAREERLLKAFGVMAKTLKDKDITIAIPKAATNEISIERVAGLAAEAVVCGQYEFTKVNTEPKEFVNYTFKGVGLEESINDGIIVGEAINHTRDLGNMPSNMMYPEILAEYARKMSKDNGLEIDVLDNRALEKLGAGGILGVNLGSDKEARLIVVKYTGADKNEPYTALVGKGLTFDSGGYNLKPGASMDGMKFDMCGGASVLGAIELIARRKVKANVFAVVPSTENKISGEAYTCDDVLVSLNGKTVEIKNTDAEGRLILMDGITYAQRNLGATRVVDIATLTGAVMMALGNAYTGVFANNEDFYNQFVDSAKESNEPIWRLPLSDVYRKEVRTTNVADIINSVPRSVGAGSSTAACFLEEFIEEGTEWIHLDVAGTASGAANDLGPIGATGAMVKSMANLFK